MEEKAKKPFYKKWWFIAIVVILLLAIIGGALGDDEPAASENPSKKEVTPSNEIAEEPEEEPVEEPVERNAAIGEAIPLDNVEVAVLEVEELDQVGNEYANSTVSDGGVYVAVVSQMKNVSDEPIGMFDHPEIKLVDENGTEYSNDVSASAYYSTQRDLDNSKAISDLNPGITVKNTMVFEVSKELFNRDTWKIKFEQNKQEKLVDLN